MKPAANEALDHFQDRAPSEMDVRAELARILSSPNFQANEKRREFLKFTIEETLAGRAHRLKGYTIALAVFYRDETFDAQADPVVRLEARKLRRDLDSYYMNAGSRDPVRISIPKGSYIPHFELHQEPEHQVSLGEDQAITQGRVADPSTGISQSANNPSPSHPRILLLGVLIVAGVIVAAAGWFLSTMNDQTISGADQRQPAVVVLPFEALDPTESTRYLADGLAHELIGELRRFPGFRLYTLPVSPGGEAQSEPFKVGRGLGVTYVVKGNVIADGEEIHVAMEMIDAKTGEVVWTEAYDRSMTAKAVFHVNRELAGEIATVIGQPYGVLNADLNARQTAPEVSHMQSYVCVLRAYDYRRGFAREKFDRALRCLEEAVRRDPGYSDAWAMLGWLHLDAGRNGYAGYDRQDEYEKALQAASEARRLAPNSIRPLKVLGAVNHFLGHYDDSERVLRQALEINPHDPETLAQFGWKLCVRGRFEEGIPLLKRAIARTVNPPGWYFSLLGFDHFLKGEYEKMFQVAKRSADGGRGVSQALIAIAATEVGNYHAAQRALVKMSEFESFARDPAAYLRRHGYVDEIMAPFMAGLQKARRVAATSQ